MIVVVAPLGDGADRFAELTAIEKQPHTAACDEREATAVRTLYSSEISVVDTFRPAVK
jgi:hypothetical protein